CCNTSTALAKFPVLYKILPCCSSEAGSVATASDVRLLIGNWDEELIEPATFASTGEPRMHNKAIKKYKGKRKN
ncbi:MAG: hypothetical protein ACYTX0_59255, partial [Nostoc sp.]